MCFPSIIKCNFGGKNMDIICRFYPFAYYIYFICSLLVGFESFAVFGCKDL